MKFFEGLSYRVGVNQFADLDVNEFAEKYLSAFNRTREANVVKLSEEATLDSVGTFVFFLVPAHSPIFSILRLEN